MLPRHESSPQPGLSMPRRSGRAHKSVQRLIEVESDDSSESDDNAVSERQVSQPSERRPLQRRPPPPPISPIDSSDSSDSPVVQRLIRTYMGQGYRLFIDNFYTSPTLRTDLYANNTVACGTVRENRRGFPKPKVNCMPRNAPRGTIRWIRNAEPLFVKWKDMREVGMLSTVHKACGNDTVHRKTKNARTGVFERVEIPIPPAVKDYNTCMGGVDLSDQLPTTTKSFTRQRNGTKPSFSIFLTWLL